MKWLVDSLRGYSNVQGLLHFLEKFCGLTEVNCGESNSLTRNFVIVLDCKYNREGLLWLKETRALNLSSESLMGRI